MTTIHLDFYTIEQKEPPKETPLIAILKQERELPKDVKYKYSDAYVMLDNYREDGKYGKVFSGAGRLILADEIYVYAVLPSTYYRQ